LIEYLNETKIPYMIALQKRPDQIGPVSTLLKREDS
jgi:hypothetical protein